MEYNFDNLSIEERKTFNTLLEKARMPCKTWKPKRGEYYYMIHHSGGTRCVKNYEDNFSSHCFEINNCFKTEAEAKFEEERRKYLAWYKRLSIEAGENENEWDGENRHYYANVMFDDGHIFIDDEDTYKSESTYFPTKEACQNAIDIIGKDNFRKYVLKIK